MDFIDLARQCAPDVHITTMSAVVRHESGFDPLAIGVNGKPHRTIRPKSKQEAVEHARNLIAQGADFDVGYGQINVRNWQWLGVTPDTIFDPCVNLNAAQRVLVDCYTRAAKRFGGGQQALYAAFSCYNTGTFQRGFENGYVRKVLAAAGLPVPRANVPAISQRKGATARTDAQLPKSPGQRVTDANAAANATNPDAFTSAAPDAFLQSSRDAFGRPADSPFGHRVLLPHASK